MSNKIKEAALSFFSCYNVEITASQDEHGTLNVSNIKFVRNDNVSDEVISLSPTDGDYATLVFQYDNAEYISTALITKDSDDLFTAHIQAGYQRLTAV